MDTPRDTTSPAQQPAQQPAGAPSSGRRTQAERNATTRAALVEAGRRLFSTKGFADVATDELARAAGVTRGALYHQYDGKSGLFAAVLESVEAEVVARVSGAMDSCDDPTDPATRLLAGLDAYLDACADPTIHRITLVEGPPALGWRAWREVGHRHAIGLVEESVRALAPAAAPVAALAHVLMGALGEAALYVAAAEDPVAAREEARAAVLALVPGLS
ncbi:TetR/AcrR family transcriptional regulator [Nocardioides sp.]|uniref:TetR/AcrR family transcriptional regulator n=1 Tax=Nocardioides sp. TaxID=35761 RepID=UPI0035145A09